MNNIEKAISLLTAAVAESKAADAPITLNLELTREEFDLLHEVARLDVTIPNVILESYLRTTKTKVKFLLNKLFSATTKTP
jgi:hypothetical protein